MPSGAQDTQGEQQRAHRRVRGRVFGALLAAVVLCGSAWYAYRHEAVPVAAPANPVRATSGPTSPASQLRAPVKPLFRCDGRTQCEQMTSCEEAMFFVKNCPHTKMDKDKDGIPCEIQWCQR
jgi:hypothetical protein